MQEGPKMKTRFLLIPALAVAMILGGCASGGYVMDDLYYTPGQNGVNTVAATNNTAQTNSRKSKTVEQPAEASGDEAFSAIDNQYRDNTYNEDTLQLSPQEAEANQGGNVVINNYNGSYAARINHFFYPSLGMGYYDPLFYNGYYDPFYGGGYYDPFFNPGLSFSLGFGFGYGYGYGMPYYNPWFYSPYSYYPYYGGGFYPYYGGYYGSYGNYYPIYPDNGENYNPKYGHRNSIASNRLYGPGTTTTTAPEKSSFIPTDSRRVGTRTRSTGTATTVSQPRGITTATSTRSTGTRTTTTAKQGNTRTTTYQPRRVSEGGNHIRTTRLPQHSTTNASVREHRTTGSTGRTYIPRYVNTRSTRTTARPSYNYNPSHSVGTTRSRSVTSSPTIKRRSYSPPVRRSSSIYSAPRRSYTPSSSSFNRSSSSSFSAPRSTSTSTRSSGSGGRRR